MDATLTGQLTTLRSQYDREGYVAARHVIEPELVEEGRRHIEWLLDQNPGRAPSSCTTG